MFEFELPKVPEEVVTKVRDLIIEIHSWTVEEADIADEAWNDVGDKARDAAWEAAWEAVLCAVASDLISLEHQKVLNAGLNAVREYRVKAENASAHGDTRRRELAEWARKRAKKARKKAERSGGTVHPYERADILDEIADALEGEK